MLISITAARSGAARWFDDRLENARFRLRLLRVAFGRLDNLPASFVLAAGQRDRDVDWLQEPGSGWDWQ